MSNATISNKTLYRVKLNTDTSEGRGETYYEHYSTRIAATQGAKGRGGMGTDAPVEPINVQVVQSGEFLFLLGDRVSTYFPNQNELREEALKKLTDEEKTALGLV